jgi:predicted TIM-barrel fold metal-dependent hydrolase
MPASKPYIVDAAQHWIEPPDLWTSRLPAALREAAPRVVGLPEGGEAWSFAGGAWLRPLADAIPAVHGPVDAGEAGFRYENIRKGGYDAKERLADLRADGLDAAAIFPTFGQSVRNLVQDDLHLACVRAYNDGLAEWVDSGDPDRLLPNALLPASGLDAALAELDRVIARGFRGIVFPGWPAGGESPTAEEDQFWARCAEAGLVVHLLGGGPTTPDRTPAVPPDWIGAGTQDVRAIDLPPGAAWGQRASPKGTNLAWIILTGILERFPDLKVALTETGAGWLPFYLEQMDDMYRRGRFWAHAKLTYMPSDFYRRQVTCTVDGDRFGVEARAEIGVHTLLWASGYPTAPAAAWPAARLAIADQLRGVPEEDRRRILGENAAALYGLGARQRAAAVVG